jgi:hypothetical protein
MFLQWTQEFDMPLNLAQFQVALAELDSEQTKELCLMNDLLMGSTVGHVARSMIASSD